MLASVFFAVAGEECPGVNACMPDFILDLISQQNAEHSIEITLSITYCNKLKDGSQKLGEYFLR